MGSTRRSDIIVPEILAEGMPGAFAGMSLLAGTGAVVISPTLRASKAEVGDQVKIPLFGTIGEMQDIAEGGAATIQKLAQTSELATVQHAAIAIGIGQWAQIAAADDPYAECRRQIVIAAKRKIDAKLIVAARATTSILNRYNLAAGTDGTLNYDMGADAMGLFGDESEEGDFVMWGVHSKVKTDLRKTKDSTGRALLSDQEGSLSRFMGIPVVQSDRLTADTTVDPYRYESLLMKKGALAAWINPDMGIQEDRDILSDDVIMAFHLYYCVHLYSRAPNSTYCGAVKVQHR